MNRSDDTTAKFERALAQAGTQKIKLQLFIAGMGPRSTRAIADLGRLCRKFGDRLDIEIVDIYEHPGAAAEAQIVAVPALVRNTPLPTKRLIGSIGDTLGVARRLGLVTGSLTGAA